MTDLVKNVNNNLDWDGLAKLYPHTVDVPRKFIPSAGCEDECKPFAWCRINFGPERFECVEDNSYRVNHNAIWDSWNEVYGFQSSDDALLFKLTWGGVDVSSNN